MMNELYHHGVKGMKWGVRKQRPTSSVNRAASSTKKYISAKHYTSKHATYKRSKSMTDEQLRSANKRYNLEQQYRLNVQNDVRAGRSHAGTILNKSGGIFVNAAIGAAAGAAGAMVGKKILSSSQNIDVGALLAWLGAR